jgi:hypothetical protein
VGLSATETQWRIIVSIVVLLQKLSNTTAGARQLALAGAGFAVGASEGSFASAMLVAAGDQEEGRRQRRLLRTKTTGTSFNSQSTLQLTASTATKVLC